MSIGNALLARDYAYRYLSPANNGSTVSGHCRSLNVDNNMNRSRSSTASSGGSLTYSRKKTSLTDSPSDQPKLSATSARQMRLYSLPSEQTKKVSISPEETVRRFASTLSGTFRNVGDSRRRSTRKISLVAANLMKPLPMPGNSKIEMEIIELDDGSIKEFTVFHIVILGCSGSGKRSLLKQFASSEYRGIYSFTYTPGLDSSTIIPVMIDEEEIRLQFFILHANNVDVEVPVADAYLVVYDITDRKSFTQAAMILRKINGVPVIVVGNKVDLVRNRAVPRKDGIALSRSHKVRFIETSAALNDHVDQLLAGCVRQIQKDRTIDVPNHTKTKKKRTSFLSKYCMPFNKRFDPEELS